MIKGSFFILLFYFLGEMLSLLIRGFIPGSVLGMILLFFCLFFKILKPDNVKSVATVITKNMAVFFVPAGVGLMVYAELLSKSLFTILIAIAVPGSMPLNVPNIPKNPPSPKARLGRE